MVGDTLNLASRLVDIARPDEILVSSRTQRLISAYYETQPLQPVKLKGLSRLVHPFRILGEKDVKTRFDAAKQHGLSAFTGRSRELGALHDRLGQTLAGRGRIVTVTGEPGMGKSRLAYEFCHTIDRQRVTVLEARCETYGSNTPYLPLLDALKRYFSLSNEDTTGELEHKIVARIRAIDPALETHLPLVLHLLSIPSDAYRLPENLVGRKFKSTVNEALATMILLYARRKPTVLVLEDWHWADEASHSILMHLAGLIESFPLMLLVLYRPERTLEWPDWHYRSACVLDAMDRQNTGRIIRSSWNVDALSEGLASFVHDHTGGNPYFIEEVCRALKENGSVRIDGRTAVLVNPAEHLELPATVQAVIKARLDRLAPAVKETLQLAAVIGRQFSLGLLKRICGGGCDLSMAIDVLNNQELIEQTHPDAEDQYKFKHALTQVAVYESLLLKKRRRIHAAIGVLIEHVHAGRLEEQCENLAHHFANSADTRKALFYLQMAGGKATRIHSLAEARRYYDSALALLGTKRLRAPDRIAYIDLALKWAEVSQYAPSNKIRTALIHSLEYAKTAGELPTPPTGWGNSVTCRGTSSMPSPGSNTPSAWRRD